MNLALVCELGRDDVCFGLIEVEGTGAPFSVETLHVSDYLTFTDAIIFYLRKVGRTGKIKQFALAVAGVSNGNSVGATNGRWLLSISGLKTFLACEPLVLNDFAASAFSLKSLPSSAFRPVGIKGASCPTADASFVLIGPLDGLGVAALLSQRNTNFVVQSEAGHAGLAPVSQDAHKFLDGLRKKYRTVYAEHLLSDDGLRRAYSFFANDGSVEIGPATSTRIIGRIRSDPAAKAAVDLFVSQLAAFSRDMVITFGAWRGLYFSGPTANALFETLSAPAFKSQFADNHSYSRLLRDVPIGVVVQQKTAMLGLAAAIRQQHQ